jgi:hypothetical protein
MRVRVKKTQVEGFFGFYGLKRRYPGDEFTLVEKQDKDGKVITCEDQFSHKWMEKIETEAPKRKRRTKEEMEADAD